MTIMKQHQPSSTLLSQTLLFILLLVGTLTDRWTPVAEGKRQEGTFTRAQQAAFDRIIAPIADRFPSDDPPIPFRVPPYTLPHREPSKLTLEERNRRNSKRFPGEWFPTGYDVQEPAPQYTATAKTIWTSPRALAIDVAHEPRLWAQQLNPGQPRPPGKLLLNMLVKNEAEHLARTLPLWAKIIDYWIIGVDDANTDDSVDVIKRILSDLPGEICEVHFDGIGPTWNQVTQLGILHFPGATHGILADADYTPLKREFNRMDLDIRASMQLYPVWNEELTNARQIDWIYRNVPGARVTRRCHHSVSVPPQPDQVDYLIETNSLPVFDRPGGYGDRAGGKQLKYIKWLELDLLEWPNDPHTTYYLAHSHHDLYGLNPSPANLHHVHAAIGNFSLRATITEGGSPEGRFWALIKSAEMSHNWLHDTPAAIEFYRRAIRMDPWRLDGYYYLAQMFRQLRTFDDELRAEAILREFTDLDMPPRSWFQWFEVYSCSGRLEYAKIIYTIPTRNLKRIMLTKAMRAINTAKCTGSDYQTQTELLRIIPHKKQEWLDMVARGEISDPDSDETETKKKKKKKKKSEKSKEEDEKPQKSKPSHVDAVDDDPSPSKTKSKKPAKSEDSSSPSSTLSSTTSAAPAITRPLFTLSEQQAASAHHLEVLTNYLHHYHADQTALLKTLRYASVKDKFRDILDTMEAAIEEHAAQSTPFTCRAYRLLTTPLFRLIQSESTFRASEKDELKALHDECR